MVDDGTLRIAVVEVTMGGTHLALLDALGPDRPVTVSAVADIDEARVRARSTGRTVRLAA